MDTTQISGHFPLIVFGAVCLGFIYLLFRFKKTHDFIRWMHAMNDEAAHAANDSAYCAHALNEAETALRAMPNDENPQPVTRFQETAIRMFPRIIFPLGAMAAATLFIAAATWGVEEEPVWPLYFGVAVLAIVACMYMAHRWGLGTYRRIQALNRKYVMQKIAGDDGLFETMRQILVYYPHMPRLWMELAGQYARQGDLDKALETVAEARKINENSLDIAMAEGLYLLRKDDVDGADAALRRAGTLQRQKSDPRPAIFRAALALKKGDTAKTRENAEEALRLDRRYTLHTIPGEPALKELQSWMEKENLAEFAS